MITPVPANSARPMDTDTSVWNREGLFAECCVPLLSWMVLGDLDPIHDRDWVKNMVRAGKLKSDLDVAALAWAEYGKTN